jgi:HSP20 family protein
MKKREKEVVKMNDKSISKKVESGQNSYLSTFRNFEQRMENMFHDMWQNNFHREKFPDLFSYGSLTSMPKMDVVDRDKEIFVKAELPGFDKDDLDISIANNQLVIKAKTSHEEKEEKGDYLRQEISKSEIYRSVLLPGDVEEDNIKSSYKDGVLELTIPKQEKSQRKQIKIN